jgi:hypothetical protein
MSLYGTYWVYTDNWIVYKEGNTYYDPGPGPGTNSNEWHYDLDDLTDDYIYRYRSSIEVESGSDGHYVYRKVTGIGQVLGPNYSEVLAQRRFVQTLEYTAGDTTDGYPPFELKKSTRAELGD